LKHGPIAAQSSISQNVQFIEKKKTVCAQLDHLVLGFLKSKDSALDSNMETAKDYRLSPKHHERSGKKLDLTECSIHPKEKKSVQN
jgi:hypothetical protein